MNPLATILSAGMMLDHLQLPQAATDIERAVAKVLSAGQALTADLGGSSSTAAVAGAVVEAL